MLRILAASAVLAAVAAPAQVTSYTSNRPAPIQGDADKIVCQKQETLGTRLGAKKLCLTVREWRERQMADRDQTESIQAGTRAKCEGCPDQAGKIF